MDFAWILHGFCRFFELKMEIETTFSVELIVETSKNFFPFITNENFSFLFKLTPKMISENLVSTSKNTIRDFLILLYWCKHGSPSRTLGVLFGLQKSRICEILNQQLEFWSEKAKEFISFEFREISTEFFIENCIGSVDGTEFRINSWIGDSYSGKQGYKSSLN
jgi:hypothetical protein